MTARPGCSVSWLRIGRHWQLGMPLCMSIVLYVLPMCIYCAVYDAYMCMSIVLYMLPMCIYCAVYDAYMCMFIVLR